MMTFVFENDATTYEYWKLGVHWFLSWCSFQALFRNDSPGQDRKPQEDRRLRCVCIASVAVSRTYRR